MIPLGLSGATAALIPLIVVMLVGQPYINFLKKRYLGQHIREDGPESHQSKAGTPTAGGVIILLGVMVGWIALGLLGYLDIMNIQAALVAGTTLAFALLGFVDDFMKIAKKKNKGVSGYTKLAVQVAMGLVCGWFMMQLPGGSAVSLFGGPSIELGLLYPLFATFVVTGASNSVNLTDGLDGLATSTAIFSFFSMALIFHVIEPNLALMCHVLTGACIGFLVFNHYPARIFMGDTGSLALGGALGALAVTGKIELWLTFLAFIYIAEAVSVILQVLSFKTTGKRIFRMSPLHHHFELGGWKEPKVVFVFVTVQMLTCTAAVLLFRHFLPAGGT